MPITLLSGSRGFDVAVVQAQLNARSTTNPILSVDGEFGPITRTAVMSFQRRVGLKPDGIVGPLTHAALAKGLILSTANHNVTHIAQPTSTTCWAASTAMMTRSTVAAVVARTPSDMIAADGTLLNSSESDQAIVTGTRYGNLHGLRCHAPMSWSISAFIAILRQGPVMLDMLWDSFGYSQGRGSPGHFIVISAVVSDNNPSGSGTHLLILDPWPVKVGKLSWVEHRKWINEVTTRTYRVFTR